MAPALNIPSLIDLGPAIGLEIAFEMDIQGSINFTYGAKGKVRPCLEPIEMSLKRLADPERCIRVCESCELDRRL